MSSSPAPEETALVELDRLVEQSAPYLIGVRHHSPSLARVLPRLLDAAAPTAIAVELPPEAAPWLEWLTHPETVTPVALALADAAAGAAEAEPAVGFYPFADFSPELVALRWAAAHGVPVTCIDLPVAARARARDAERTEIAAPPERDTAGYAETAHRMTESEDSAQSWDRLVEARSTGADPEAIRRAALVHGWGTRRDESLGGEPDQAPDGLGNRLREAAMRSALRGLDGRVVAIVGAFHAPALTRELLSAAEQAAADESLLAASVSAGDPVASLVGYGMAELDLRSGYPAGIADPLWQQEVFADGDSAAALQERAAATLTAVAREIRGQGHPCGTGEATEAVRMALDLATLRGLAAPGRRELLEAMTVVFAHGDILGRGRAVSRAAQIVLVGDRRGRVASGTPTSGLVRDLRARLDELKLRRADGEELRLDPLRSPLDGRRERFLQRALAAGIPVANPVAGTAAGGMETVTTRWRCNSPERSEALAEAVAVLGATVDQAARAALQRRLATGWDAAVGAVRQAVRAGFPDLARSALDRARTGIDDVSLRELIELISVAAWVVDVVPDPDPDLLSACVDAHRDAVGRAAAQVPGLAGGTSTQDARLLGELARIVGPEALRLADALGELADAGPPFAAGAARAALEELHAGVHVGAIGAEARRRILAAGRPESRRDLRLWLGGLLSASPRLLIDSDSAREGFADVIGGLDDSAFVTRLPTLRGGFEALDDGQCDQLLAAFGARGRAAPAMAARWAVEDEQARRRLAAMGLASQLYSPAERWKLVLGRHQSGLTGRASTVAATLDRAYGARSDTGTGVAGRGGAEPPEVSVREWNDIDLADLFGTDVREDVLAAAAGRGDRDAALSLDPVHARPSVELLQSILGLRGGMPPDAAARLRLLVRRCVDELSRSLATTMIPALHGLTTARRTLRPTRRFDPRATIERNLAHTLELADGTRRIVPHTPVFRAPVQRSVGWHVIVLVDVSGSMEPSTVFAALTAAVLAGVPALSVSFLTFSTEVVDLSEHATDPLELLLEIAVGGGTDIALGLRAAAELIRVPRRTLLVTVSDFENGGDDAAMLAAVRALADSGVAMLGCAALDDAGAARYDLHTASKVAAAGMPVSAVTPAGLASWVGETVVAR